MDVKNELKVTIVEVEEPPDTDQYIRFMLDEFLANVQKKTILTGRLE